MDLENIRFPIGRYQNPGEFSSELIDACISNIESMPARLINLLEGISENELDTPYRDGGWTIRQVVHHLADSHMNGYIRMKLATTEINPTINPYSQDKWAQLADSTSGSINPSIGIIKHLHKRWTLFLKNLAHDDYQKTFYHPESDQYQSVGIWLSLYSWHCDHHLGHIAQVKIK